MKKVKDYKIIVKKLLENIVLKISLKYTSHIYWQW